MAVLLAAVIMIASVPVMKTDAASAKPLAIKAKVIQWGSIMDSNNNPIAIDCTTSYIGIDASYDPTAFEYALYAQDGTMKGHGSYTGSISCEDENGKKYACAKILKGRKTVVTYVRIRAKIKGKWSAWTGLIAQIPLHTKDYVKVTANNGNRTINVSWSKFTGMSDYEIWVSTSPYGGWKMATRTKGTSYTVKSFGGKALQRGTPYYVKVIGRAKIGSTMTKAKGDYSGFVSGTCMF